MLIRWEKEWEEFTKFSDVHTFISTEGQQSDENQFIYNSQCVSVKYISVWKQKQAR